MSARETGERGEETGGGEEEKEREGTGGQQGQESRGE